MFAISNQHPPTHTGNMHRTKFNQHLVIHKKNKHVTIVI